MKRLIEIFIPKTFLLIVLAMAWSGSAFAKNNHEEKFEVNEEAYSEVEVRENIKLPRPHLNGSGGFVFYVEDEISGPDFFNAEIAEYYWIEYGKKNVLNHVMIMKHLDGGVELIGGEINVQGRISNRQWELFVNEAVEISLSQEREIINEMVKSYHVFKREESKRVKTINGTKIIEVKMELLDRNICYGERFWLNNKGAGEYVNAYPDCPNKHQDKVLRLLESLF